MLIQPQYLRLSELLAKRLFRIPEYQRAYSWLPKQRDDLFSDIDKLRGTKATARISWQRSLAYGGDKKRIVTDEFPVL